MTATRNLIPLPVGAIATNATRPGASGMARLGDKLERYVPSHERALRIEPRRSGMQFDKLYTSRRRAARVIAEHWHHSGSATKPTSYILAARVEAPRDAMRDHAEYVPLWEVEVPQDWVDRQAARDEARTLAARVERAAQRKLGPAVASAKVNGRIELTLTKAGAERLIEVLVAAAPGKDASA